eukprot:GHVU01047345.1.p3 GENE.GHVU01047345.1~~GHVU01047345.1.p3  ORF type:complete len:111 (+),score=17.04 GHVU01047345.1:164-496(+)
MRGAEVVECVFDVLYTHQKTQKKKKWQEGVVDCGNSNGFVRLVLHKATIPADSSRSLKGPPLESHAIAPQPFEALLGYACMHTYMHACMRTEISSRVTQVSSSCTFMERP